MSLFESPGEWWLPETPLERVPGVLRATRKSGVRVSLFRSLSDAAPDFQRAARYPVILGSIHESPLPGGTDVSLFDAFATSRSLRSNGTSAETIVANRCYVGDAHMGSPADLHRRYVATFSGLLEWLPFSAIGREVDERGGIHIELLNSVRKEASISTAMLAFVVSGEVAYSANEIRLSDRASVDVRPTQPCNYDTAMRDFLVPLRNFLSLALGETSHVSSCQIVVSDETGPWLDVLHDLRLYEQDLKQAAEQRSHRDALIAPPKEAAQLATLLDRWWQMTSQHRRIVDFVFALLEDPPRFVDVKFMNASLAVDLLAEHLAGGRVAELLGRFGDVIWTQLGSPEQFVVRWQAARSGLWTSDPPASVEKINLAAILIWIIRLSLLSELGVSLEPAARSPAFRHYARRLAEPSAS